MIYDCSPRIDETLAVWPGDEPFVRRWTLRLEDGASVNLSATTSTVHLGSHADAPLHYVAGGDPIDKVPLELYLGHARVIRVDESHIGPDRRIAPSALDAVAEPLPPRLLLCTGTHVPHAPYTNRFAALSPALVERMAALGVRLVGIDTPSVDPLEDKTLASHHALGRAGILIIEGLVLEHVPPGDYELIAPPLRIGGADASPIRALLRTLS